MKPKYSYNKTVDLRIFERLFEISRERAAKKYAMVRLDRIITRRKIKEYNLSDKVRRMFNLKPIEVERTKKYELKLDLRKFYPTISII